MIYYIIFGIVLFFALFTDLIIVKQFKRIEKQLFIAVAFFLFLFVGLRADTGYDYQTYKIVFEEIGRLNFYELIQSNFWEWLEPGYIFLNFFFKLFPFEFFLFIVTMFAMIPKYVYIYKFCDKKMFGLFFYYCIIMLVYDMGIIRQSIALGLCLWGYYFLVQKKYKHFVCLILSASLFHAISLLMFIMLLFKDKYFSNRFYLVAIGGAFLMSLIHPLNVLLKLLPTLGGNYISGKLNYYANDYYTVGDTAAAIYLSVLKRLIVILLFIFIINRKVVMEESANNLIIHFNAFFVSIILALIMIDIPIIAGRGTAMFQITQMFVFTDLLNAKYSRVCLQSKFGYKMGIFIICIVLAYYSFSGVINMEDYTPYINLFFYY